VRERRQQAEAGCSRPGQRTAKPGCDDASVHPDPPSDSLAATPSAPLAQPSFESWSTQPPRYGDRRLPRGLLVIAGCVAIVVAVAVVLIVRFGSGHPSVPDTRALLVPVPADALACGRDDTLFSGDRVAHTDGVPAALTSALSGSGLLSVAYRCWLQLGGSEVDVMLLRFDTTEEAGRVVPGGRAGALAGITDMADVPGVPSARSFRLLALPDRLWVLGVRGATAFAILGTIGSGMDVDAIDEIAGQQYARL